MTAAKKISLDFGGMSDQQVGEMAAGTLEQGGYILPPPSPVAAEPVEIGKFWTRSGPQQVTRQRIFEDSGVKLTEVFDFATRQCCEVYDNGQKDTRSAMRLTSLDEVDQSLVEEARGALQALGGQSP